MSAETNCRRQLTRSGVTCCCVVVRHRRDETAARRNAFRSVRSVQSMARKGKRARPGRGRRVASDAGSVESRVVD